MNKGFELAVARDLEDLGRKGADLFAQIVCDAAQSKDRVAVALAGGNTPRRLYEHLAKGETLRAIPWRRVHLFWGDERCVPPDDPESNYRTAHDSFISRVSIPTENVHRMPGENPDPSAAAEDYEASLHRFFISSVQEWPRFDLVLLGIGTDGHTASLFPASPVLSENRSWVAAPYIKKLKAHRLTLTLPVLNHAAQLLFLVSGSEKAAVMKEILPDERQPVHLPFQMIRPHRGNRTFLLDQEAAGLVDSSKWPSRKETA